MDSTVIAKLDYGNILFNGLPNNTMDKLQRVQNTAARIITKTGRYEHITPSMIALHWLPVKHRVMYKVLLQTFKALNNQSPFYIKDMLHPYKPQRELRSGNATFLQVPKTKTGRYGDGCFLKSAPVLWNNLPEALRKMEAIGTFKRALKTYLFKQAYNL